jgi:hypothetical protein
MSNSKSQILLREGLSLLQGQKFEEALPKLLKAGEALQTAGLFVQEKLNAEPQSEVLFGEPLLTISKLAQKNLMSEATFLLCYQESFRSEFEKWKQDNPGLFVSFIETQRLRPY